MTLFRVRNLDFSYQLGSQKVQALKNISLETKEGSFICLTGPSGSGKSTLLNLLGLIEPIQSGSISFCGQDFGQMSESEKNKIRRYEIGFIFQNFHLFPILDAFENVEYFLTQQGVSRSKRKEGVEAALKGVGLWEHRHKRPLQMSGGQRQRVAIARAVAKHPKVLLADEPTASLDQATGRKIMEILKSLAKSHGLSVFVSSHDPMVMDFAEEKIQLRDGEIVNSRSRNYVSRHRRSSNYTPEIHP